MAQVAVKEGVPRPPSSHVQIALRVPKEWLDDAQALAVELAASRPGFVTTRSDVLRAAIAKGLEVMRDELATPPPAPPSRPRSKKR